MRRALGLLLAVVVFHVLSPEVATQSADLRVISAGPTGEINQLQDANEIRVIFSEPMVALGRMPSNPTPPWIRISPAIAGTFRWSGTTILIFTPDPATPLPHSTRYTVTIDARPRATPAARWRRRSSSRSRRRRSGSTSRAGIDVRTASISRSCCCSTFNQPVRAEDVAVARDRAVPAARLRSAGAHGARARAHGDRPGRRCTVRRARSRPRGRPRTGRTPSPSARRPTGTASASRRRDAGRVETTTASRRQAPGCSSRSTRP